MTSSPPVQSIAAEPAKRVSPNGCELGPGGSCLTHTRTSKSAEGPQWYLIVKLIGDPTTDTSDVKPETCRSLPQCTDVSKVKAERQVGV